MFRLKVLVNIFFSCFDLESFLCPRGEIFSLCGNNECRGTCKHPYGKKFCEPKCIPGCICEKGRLRRESDNRCVLPSACDEGPGSFLSSQQKNTGKKTLLNTLSNGDNIFAMYF